MAGLRMRTSRLKPTPTSDWRMVSGVGFSRLLRTGSPTIHGRAKAARTRLSHCQKIRLRLRALGDQQLHDRVLLARLGVADEGNAVRSLEIDHRGIVRQEGFYDLDLSHHSGAEDVHAGAVGEQELGYGLVAHVRGAAQGGLPIAAAPIPRGVDQRRLLLEQLAGAVELAVTGDDELADHVEVEPGSAVRNGGGGGGGGRGRSLSGQASSDGGGG